MTPTQQSSHPVEVFFSYSHKDEELRDELADHLIMLERQHVITAWHDRRIGAGEEWKGAIDEHLNTADVILLLVSSKFLASAYCYDVEMARAMERYEAGEATVIPVILRAVDWKTAPFARLQALPTDAKPVTSWQNVDEAFENVAKGIRVAIEKLFPAQSESSTPRRQVQNKSRNIWNIPHRENPNFTGRKDLLARLRESLISNQHATLTQAIHGLGGVGKTQLAVEYAYRHEKDYALVWWVRAEEAATLAADYAALAGELDLKEKNGTDQRIIIEAVRRYLEQNKNWLLIFDNAGDKAEVLEYLPRTSSGHVIITSRNPNWLGTANPLPVEVMQPSEAVDFMIKRTGQTDTTAAASLAETLGYLPLALEQAGAYIEQTTISYDEYLELFREYQHELLKEGTSPPDYPDTVATTWNISFQQVQEASPEGANLLNLCAYLAPDDIPVGLIRERATNLPESLARAMADPLLFNKAIAVLQSYSFVERKGEMLSVHRLVQAVTRDRLYEDAKKTWAEVALRLVNDAFPSNIQNDVSTWPKCSLLLPHALEVDRNIGSLNMDSETNARLLLDVGDYLHVHAELKDAENRYRKALRIIEGVCGADHPNVARYVNNLGSILQSRGDLKGAKQHYERAIKIDEKAYGPEHPSVAPFVNNLGDVLKSLGDLKSAKQHFERAFRIAEKAYGPEHPNVARYVNNLGTVLKSLGDLEGAKQHYERALKIDEKAYGKKHPNVAIRVNNLGGVLQSLGDLKGAKQHYERALKIDEMAYGKEHPNVATNANNLGAVLQSLGDLKGAKESYERALRIGENAYGQEHPNVTKYVNNLGGVLQSLGDLKGAKQHYERAIRIDENAYGKEHPNVAKYVNNLGCVLQSLGDLKGAKQHYERAIRIDEAVYGPNHPDVARDVNNLGYVLTSLGDLKDAKQHYERALQILTKYFGEDHPNTIGVKNNLDALESHKN